MLTTLTCFRFAVVYEMVPENLHKLFNNMRKSDERKERQKSLKTTDPDDPNTKENSRKRKSETSVFVIIFLFLTLCVIVCLDSSVG